MTFTEALWQAACEVAGGATAMLIVAAIVVGLTVWDQRWQQRRRREQANRDARAAFQRRLEQRRRGA